MDNQNKFYLTKQGLEKFQNEFEILKSIRLSKTKGEEAPNIWQSEDINPEYLSFKDDLDLLDSRIFELENILKNVEMIKCPPKNKRDVISLGANITIQANGQEDEFFLVGTLEANPSEGMISNNSPVGKALLGKKIGDQVIVSSPVKTVYKIKKIKYHTS